VGWNNHPACRCLDLELPRVLAHDRQNNQAVFVLKGKPLNAWDPKRDVMCNLM
jgi:hypothetical protein